MSVRLGGFVIHGNAQVTLGACLDSLLAVCDRVVTIDSDSTDGSAALVDQRGLESVRVRWRGYGASRVEAVRALSDCDYLFFLDSDETLSSQGIDVLRRWKEETPRHAIYRVPRRDWVLLPHTQFVYRTERRRRLVRREAAAWTERMIVHEALPGADCGFLDAPVEHRFVTTLEHRAAKDRLYALLWAVQAAVDSDRRPPRWLWTKQVGHLFRDLVLKGAGWRGGATAVSIAAHAGDHHRMKYELLSYVQDGAHADLVDLYRRGDLEALFAAAIDRSARPLNRTAPTVG